MQPDRSQRKHSAVNRAAQKIRLKPGEEQASNTVMVL